MDEMMPTINSDAIVYFGFSDGSCVSAYVESPAKRVVLVASDTGKRNDLRRLVGDDGRIEYIPVIVSDWTGTGSLQIYNIRGFASLREPVGLAKYYPGLRRVDIHDVDVRPAAEVVKEIGLDPKSKNRLVVDVPGEEQAIIRDLTESGLLELFEYVTVYGTNEVFFDDGGTLSDIISFIELFGFEVIGEERSDTGERSARILKRTPFFAELKKVASERDAEIEKSNGLAKRVEELEGGLGEITGERDDARQKVESVEAELKREHAEAIAAVETEREELRDQLSTAHATSETHASEIDRLTSERDEREKYVEQLREREAKLERQNESLEKLAADRMKSYSEISAQLRSYQTEEAEFRRLREQMRDEMQNAEGQIELLKQLILQDRTS